MTRRLTVNALLVAALAVAVAGGLLLALHGRTAVSPTADLRMFNAGNIISDTVFYDSTAMGEADIQAFLNAKGKNCTSNCLKDRYQSTSDRAADSRCGAYQGGWDSSARVIYKVARACDINPQALLVTLQKEVGLVTATSPTEHAYSRAMGMGCPDNANGACDAQYYGLYNQLYAAAHQFQNYRANPTRYSYVAGRNNIIGYNPNPGCGSATVYIQNQATAGLYNYTPYVPNQAALNAGYGTGDSCSAYGNRNFYSYFTDWFDGPQSIRNRANVTAGLGAVTTDITCGLPGGGCMQRFAYADIYWSPATGAWEVRGDILARYRATGGPSYMGYPTSGDSKDASVRTTDVYYSNFQQGDIIWTQASGTKIVRGAIRDRWVATGASAGGLGLPTGDDTPAPGGGFLTTFAGGTIYWSQATGAHDVRGDILARYLATGGPSYMGYPTGNDSKDPGVKGTDVYYSNFSQGDIIWTQASGTKIVRGAIRDRWLALGASSGALGLPTGDDTPSAGGGFLTTFAGGSIYWSEKTGAHDVRGDILARYVATGGPSYLGYPTGNDSKDDAVTTADVYYTNFSQGDIVWSSYTGARVVRGPIREHWLALGASAGVLGLPETSDTPALGGGSFVDFENGSVYWSEKTGAHDVRGAIRDRYQVVGGPAALGYPVGDDSKDRSVTTTDVYYSNFQKGDIVWSRATGAHAVPTPILKRWLATGASAGSLGLPVTDEVTDEAGTGSYVDFQRGSVYWSAGTGAHDVRGQILAKYRAAGGPSLIGYPTGNDSKDAGVRTTDVYYTNFQDGDIVWSAGTGAQLVRGAILRAWLSTGASAGTLGLPVTSDAPVAGGGGGFVVKFQRGSIWWSSDTKAHWVLKAVDDAYRTEGGPTSSYGYPISDTKVVNGKQQVDFQHGQITA